MAFDEDTRYFLENTPPSEQLIKDLKASTDEMFSSKTNRSYSLDPILENNGVFGLFSFSKLFRDKILKDLKINDTNSIYIELKDQPSNINKIQRGTLICSFVLLPELFVTIDFDKSQLNDFTKIQNKISMIFINLETVEEKFVDYSTFSDIKDVCHELQEFLDY